MRTQWEAREWERKGETDREKKNAFQTNWNQLNLKMTILRVFEYKTRLSAVRLELEDDKFSNLQFPFSLIPFS